MIRLPIQTNKKTARAVFALNKRLVSTGRCWMQALGFFSMLAYKAEEAGGWLKPSQNCARCGGHVPKTLSDRMHDCPHCGFVTPNTHRDHNAALNILFLGLTQAGREPSEVWRRVTPALRSTKPPPCDSMVTGSS